MTKSFSFGKVELVASTEAAPALAAPDPGTPFRILVLGDFSGRGNRGVARAGARPSFKPVTIDRDNFDEVMARLGVELRLALEGEGGARVALKFQELDDFHPDRIFAHAEVFHALREARRRLSDPATFEKTAEQFGMRAGTKPESSPQEPGAEPAGSAPKNLLDQILSQTAAAPAQARGTWDEFIEQIVAPYGVAARDPRQAELVAGVDVATSQLLRDILHHPDFQALEANWRALFFLTRRLETDRQLTLAIVDLTRDELVAELGAAEDLESTNIYKSLIEPTVAVPGAAPWAVLAGAWTFGPDESDLALLGRLAELARRAGAPFLAGASPRLLGCDALAATPDPDDWWEPPDRAAWEELRRHPDAPCLGLVLPRFLLRLPYGKEESPIESFDFEELTERAGPEDLLWGNPAFALVELLGRAFRHDGWGMRPGAFLAIEGLPAHIDRRGGEATLTPCAEAVLTERAAEAILDRGLMPLLSVQGRDAVILARFQSIADPQAPLAGRW